MKAGFASDSSLEGVLAEDAIMRLDDDVTLMQRVLDALVMMLEKIEVEEHPTKSISLNK